MRLHLSFRSLFYSLAAVVVIAAVLLGLTIYQRGFSVPGWVFKSRAALFIASRYDIAFGLGTLRIGCLARNCPGDIDAANLEIVINTPEPLRIQLNEMQGNRSGPLTARGLEIRSGTRPPSITAEEIQVDATSRRGTVAGLKVGLLPGPPATIAGIAFDANAKEITARSIAIQPENQPPVLVETVRLAGWQPATPDGSIDLDQVDVSGITLKIESRPVSNTTICEQLPAAVELGQQAMAPFLPLLPFFQEDFLKLREDLLRVAFAIGLVILVLKLLSILWLRRLPAVLMLGTLPAVLPAALYFYFQNLLVAAGATVVVAVLCRVFIYRRGAKWFQRWEPFAVDLASLLILLPLLGYGLEFPALPAPPTGLHVDRINVANVAGQAGPMQFQIPQTAIRGVQVALPNSKSNLVELNLSSIQIPSVAVSAPDATLVRLDEIHIDGVRAAYDTKRMAVDGISAHLRLAGFAESGRMQRELQNLEFLRGMASPVNRVSFNVDLRASDVAPQLVEEFPQSTNPLAALVAVTLNPVDCTAGFALAARVQSQPLKLIVRADGDAQGVDIRSLQTLPDSPLQIASGSGRISLVGAARMNFILGAIRGSFGATQLEMSSLGLVAALPPLGTPGRQTAAVVLGPTTIHSSDQWEVRVGSADLSFDRTDNAVSVPVTFRTSIERVAYERRGSSLIEADFAGFEATIAGRTTSEIIPRRFDGTAELRVLAARAGDEPIRVDKPIFFNADIWKGLLDIPEQDLTLRQSTAGAAAIEIPLQLSLSGKLTSVSPQLNAGLVAEAGLAQFEQALGSSRLTLNDATVMARVNVDEQGPSAILNYRTGWNSIELSPIPDASFCLEEISTLDLQAAVTLSRVAAIGGLPAMSTIAPSACVAIPSITGANPEAMRFRLSGVVPAKPDEYLVQLERENGRGIRVKDLGSEIQSLQIHDGRLESMQTRTTVTGIQNLRGEGGTDIRVDLRQTTDLLQLAAAVLTPDGIPLIEAAVQSNPAKLTLDATQQAPADRILSQIQPFLSDLDVSLGNITPQARLTQLHAEANFENGHLLDATALAQLAGGALVTTDSPESHADVSSAGPSLRLNVSRPAGPKGPRTIFAAVDAPSIQIHADTNKSTDMPVAIDVDSTLRIEARGALQLSPGKPQPISPVLNNVFQVSSGLSRQVGLLADLFAGDATPQPMENLQWNLRLAQTSPANPFLRIAPEALQLRLTDAAFEASWDRELDRSKVAGVLALDSTIATAGTKGTELFVDALAPIKLTYALDGQPETQIESDLPIQISFAPHLNEAPSKADSLWDEAYYSQFWREHPSRFAGTRFTPPIDIGEIALGPVSVQQILFPLKPLQLVVGYSDGLEFGLPLSGRVLFGAIDGKLESRLTSLPATATMDTRLNLDLKNIQLGGFGTTLSGSHSAIVEDALDGKVALHIDDLTLDRNTVAQLQAGDVRPELLDKFGLSVHLLRSPDFAGVPGVLQASSDVQINLVNKILNQIIKDLRLPAPPRAMTYSQLALDFDIERGVVQTSGEVLKLGGLKLFSSNFVDVTGEVRAHLGRPGERIMLGDLMEMLRTP